MDTTGVPSGAQREHRLLPRKWSVSRFPRVGPSHMPGSYGPSLRLTACSRCSTTPCLPPIRSHLASVYQKRGASGGPRAHRLSLCRQGTQHPHWDQRDQRAASDALLPGALLIRQSRIPPCPSPDFGPLGADVPSGAHQTSLALKPGLWATCVLPELWGGGLEGTLFSGAPFAK